MFYSQEIKFLTLQKLAKVKLCESNQKNKALVTGRGKETKLQSGVMPKLQIKTTKKESQ